MNDLTDRQKQVYRFLESFLCQHGYPPTIREIQRHFGLASTKGVKDHLDRLEAKGYIRRMSGSARAIELVGAGEGHHVVEVPVVGRVAAGSPVLATENVVGRPASAGTAVMSTESARLVVQLKVALVPGWISVGATAKESTVGGVGVADTVISREATMVPPGPTAVSV